MSPSSLKTFICLGIACIVLAAFSFAFGENPLSERHLFEKNVEVEAPLDETPTVSAELLIKFKPGTDIPEFARGWGLTIKRGLRSDPDMFVLKAGSGAVSPEQMRSLLADSSVQAAYYNLTSRNVPMAFVPNDPYFRNGNPPNFPGQWHLIYPARPELDSNVQGAWRRDLTGTGVTVGIADDGVETTHPDLAPNYVAGDSYDFADRDSVPDPVRNGFHAAGDNHGTSVAGVAAARGGNGIGVTGAAPFARIAGLRLPFGGGGTNADFVDATKYHSFGTNRSIRVKNHSYGISSPFVPSQPERDAFTDSALEGTIHVLAAGNERGKPGEDSNKKASQNSPHVIAVAALASSGVFSIYSCFGANVFVTAPSNSWRPGEFGFNNSTGIATTDRLSDSGYNPGPDNNSFPARDYTGGFGGTSSAAPLVTGIMALGVQANPNLDVRMAKHLLARSSDIVDASDNTETSDGGWKTNGAGFHFNQNYGFGLIDADELTRLATQFSGVTPVSLVAHQTPVSVNEPIPDNGQLSRTFTVEATTPLEEVEVYLNIQHPFRGDLEAYLTSPRGTTSRLFIRNEDDRTPAGNLAIDWWFTSNAFWGETPSGTWTLTVKDRFPGDTGTWTSYQFRARMGELISAANPSPPTIAGFSPIEGAVGTTVTISGTKLTGASAVKFNGVNATSFTVNSATEIRAIVPVGATPGPISVTTPGGTVASTASFQVTTVPAISSFDPTGGSIGSSVTLFGANFTGATAVKFGNVSASFTLLSATQIVATVPAGATTGRISVTTPGGTATSTANFQVTAGPSISSFTPTSGSIGSSVNLFGANLTGATAVKFNNMSAAFTLVSATQIVATVPAGATTGRISVTTPSGTSTSTGDFTVTPPPTIGNFTPGSGPIGSTVIITGTDLNGASAVRFNGVSAGTFNVDSPGQLSAVVPSGATTGPISVTTPSGTATSTGSFQVSAALGNDDFESAQTLSGDSGSIAGANLGAGKETGEPNHAGNLGGKSVWYRWTASSSGTQVFDTFGSGFDTTLALYAGASLTGLTEIAGNDDAGGDRQQSTVTVNVVAGTVYRIAVDGFNDSNALSNAASGSILLNWTKISIPPTITGFAPASASPGSTVTLSGTDFIGATAITFNGVNATSFTVVSATQITAIVPPGAGTGPIQVATAAGTATSADNFTVAEAPANDHFADAQALSGSSGNIPGTNVGASKEAGEPNHAGSVGGRSVWYAWTAPGNGIWTFDTQGSSFDTLLAVYTGNGVQTLTPIAANDDAPDLPGRASKVTFTAVEGTLYRIAVDGYVGLSGAIALQWTFTSNAPQITGFSPTGGVIGAAVTITGVNLSGATAVRFNGVSAASFTVNSATQITATVPAGTSTGPIGVTTPNGTGFSAGNFVVGSGPGNDDFVNAHLLSGNAAIVVGINAGATREAGEPEHAGNGGGKSVWYRWTAPGDGTWSLDTSDSSFDTLLAVYTGSSPGGLTAIASNDDSGEEVTSKVTFAAVAGTVYQIAVDGYNGDSGGIVLKLVPAVVPIVLYSTGFELAEGYQSGLPLAGQNGWMKVGTGGNGIVNGFLPDLGQQAYIGFDPPTTPGEKLFVWKPINYTLDTASLPVIQFSVLMQIADSTNFSFDDFEWTVYNINGNRLFRLNFDNTNLNIYYALDDEKGYISTGQSFSTETPYELLITMDFARNRWSGSIDDLLLVDNQPITTVGAALDLGDIDAVWIPRSELFPGDNYLLFDNYRITAEASGVPTIHLQPQSQSVAAGANVTFGVVAGGDAPLSYQWQLNGAPIDGAIAATLTLNSVQSGDAGSYSVVVNNAAGSASSEAATLTVSSAPHVNRAPTATPQTVTRNEDTPAAITLTGSDPDGDPLTFAVATQPSHGTLTGTAPNLTYTPSVNFNGSDAFTFQVSDGTADSAPVTVSLIISPVNDAPVLTSLGNKSVKEGQLLAFNLSASDVEESSLTFSASNLPTGASFDPAARRFSWTPTLDQAGTYTGVRFSVSDGTSTDFEEITLTVANALLPQEAAYAHLIAVMDRYQAGDAPRLLESYTATPTFEAQRNVAHLYDSVLALLTFLERGTAEELSRAGAIAEAWVSLQRNDPLNDGTLRDAYPADSLLDGDGKARLQLASSHTGNLAWAILGLMRYREVRGGEKFLAAAVRLGEWIALNTFDSRGAGGFTGGVDEPRQPLRWKSTEHNLDLYAAFMRLYEATGEKRWLGWAAHARSFAEAMWDVEEERFWTGTLEDGVTINRKPLPLDVQAWAVLALGKGYAEGLDWAQTALRLEPCECGRLKGYRFSTGGGGCWFEGTAHLSLAQRVAGEGTEAEGLLEELREVQASAPNNDGGGIVAACSDGVETGYGWSYYNALHVGATAWYLLAERGINPLEVPAISLGPSVSGTIQDSKKQPVAGVRLEAREIDGTLVGVGLTDDQGRYRLELPAGQYNLTPRRETYLFSPASRKITIKGKDLGKLNFTVRLLSLSGTVKDKKGKVLAGVDILLRQGEATVATTVTDAKGKYSFSLYNTGTYTVTPSRLGSRFDPERREVPLTNGNRGGVNFKEVP